MCVPVVGIVTVLALSSSCSSGPDLPGQGLDEGRIVIYRDTWGVPHIYAPTVEEGLYGQGWAQAEDRPEQLLLNLLMGIGEYSTAVGAEGLQVDLRSRMWDHYGVAQRRFGDIRPEIRGHLEAFAAGMNAFYAAHPEDVPSWWGERQVDAQMIVAFGRLFLYNWSIDEAYGDLRRAGVEASATRPERGSNQFAVSPGRSAEGATILAIDPHLSWHGPSRFWEFRVHAGEWQGSGVGLPGFPYIGLGHTRFLSWAMTTGGPDTADIYELTLAADDPSSYLFDGEARPLTSRQVTIEIAGGGRHEETLWFSHHGPVVAWSEGTAYAARISYAELATVGDGWYELNFGTDYEGAVRAMETLSMFPQNVMVADTSGNIYYQRTGRVPRRPEGFDWSLPVPGTSPATEWQGFHPASDHLQVLNPPQGYMQNCNVPPDAMMLDSPFRLADSTPYLFGSLDYGRRDGWTNQRGARAVELLSADTSVSVEEAMAYVNDVQPYGSDRWLDALRQAHESHGGDAASAASYRTGMEAVLAWDGQLSAASEGGLLYAMWRERLAEDLGAVGHRELSATVDDWTAPLRGETAAAITLTDEQGRAIVESFTNAAASLAADRDLGRSYGDRHRVGRGEVSWPLGGGGGGIGLATLRNVGYGAVREDGTRWGRSGQSSTQVVVMTDPPQSWLYLPLGQSDRPDSPHFADQAQLLFSKRVLKPSWWLAEDLAGNVESRTELPGAG